jgi:hypothetical protein
MLKLDFGNITEEQKKLQWQEVFGEKISIEKLEKILFNNFSYFGDLKIVYNDKSFEISDYKEPNHFNIKITKKDIKINHVFLNQDNQSKGIFTQLIYNLKEISEMVGLDEISGNRTNNFSLYAESKIGFKIRYFDTVDNVDKTFSFEKFKIKLLDRWDKIKSSLNLDQNALNTLINFLQR